MPPRFSYWTIIAGGLPTAFRAADREDLLPTFNRIQEKHPDAEMKWFARGKLWESPEAARADTERRRRSPEAVRTGAPSGGRGPGVREGERRGRDWRPGGEHHDPRQRFKDAKKAQNQERRKERFDRKQGLAAPKPRTGESGPRERDRPGGHYVPGRRPAAPKRPGGGTGPAASKRRSRGGGH